MQKGYVHKIMETYSSKGFSRRGETIYYIGTLFFIAGLILLIAGFGLILFFQVHYTSDPLVIFSTTLLMGIGLILISLGINFMIRQGKKSQIIIGLGTIFSLFAIVLFIMNYENNWYYPMISYVLALYLCGFILLMGNAFGMITLWLIHTSNTKHQHPSELKHEYTDEEINKDIEEAMRKSMQKAGDNLQLDFKNLDHSHVAMSSAETETVVKRKDDIKESQLLKQTFDPGDTEEWGTMGIEKTSNQLAAVLQQETTQKPSMFESVKHFFSRGK